MAYKEPFYKRRWFVIGAGLLITGLFCYLYSGYVIEKIEKQYPEMGQDQTELLLEQLDKPLETTKKKRSVAEETHYLETTITHRLYGIYIYVGWVFSLLGLLFMAISTKEPQVPDMDDLDDDDDTTESDKAV